MTRTDDTVVPDYPAMLRMDGRGVVVIGAGQGIGRQACHALVQAGAKVLCVDLDRDLAADIVAEVGGVAWVGNATVRADAERLFAEAPAPGADRCHRPGRHRRHRRHGPVPRPARHGRRIAGTGTTTSSCATPISPSRSAVAPCATRVAASWSSSPRPRDSPPRRTMPPTARPRPGSSAWSARPRSSSAPSASASTRWRRASCGHRVCVGLPGRQGQGRQRGQLPPRPRGAAPGHRGRHCLPRLGPVRRTSTARCSRSTAVWG